IWTHLAVACVEHDRSLQGQKRNCSHEHGGGFVTRPRGFFRPRFGLTLSGAATAASMYWEICRSNTGEPSGSSSSSEFDSFDSDFCSFWVGLSFSARLLSPDRDSLTIFPHCKSAFRRRVAAIFYPR